MDSATLQIDQLIEFKTENIYDEFFVSVLIGQLIRFNLHLFVGILINSIWKEVVERQFNLPSIETTDSLERIFNLTVEFIDGYVEHTDIVFNFEELGGNNYKFINQIILDERFLIIATTTEQIKLCEQFNILKTTPLDNGAEFNNGVIIFQRPDLGIGLVDMAFAYRAKMVWNPYSFGNYKFLKPPFKVYGWAPTLGEIPLEGIIVRDISAHGGYMYASDGHTNLAMHNEISYLGGLKFIKPKPPLFTQIINSAKKHFISFIYSDGDNLNVMNWISSKISNRSNRTFPITWTVNPNAPKFILQYIYNRTSEKDSFIAGPSGIGYCYPDHMNIEYRSNYIKDTEKIMDEVGLTILNQIGFSIAGSISFLQEQILKWDYWAPLPRTVLVPNVDAIISYDYFNYDLGHGRTYIENGVPILTGTQKLYFPENVNTLLTKEFKKGEFTIVPVNLWEFSVDDLDYIIDDLNERNPHIDLEIVNIHQLLNEFF
jgi:hypothetical protein